MASKTRSIKLPADLYDAAELRAKALGYPSLNAYFKGLLRYDLLIQGSHPLTLPWASLPLGQQDKIDAHLLDITKAGKGEKGQYLEHLMKRTQGDVGKVTGELLKGE